MIFKGYEDDELCASHDLAPQSESAFGLNWSRLEGKSIRGIDNPVEKENEQQGRGGASKGRNSSKATAEPSLLEKSRRESKSIFPRKSERR